MQIIIDTIQDLEGDDFLAYEASRPELTGRGGTPEAAVGRLILKYRLELGVDIQIKPKAQELSACLW